MYGMEKITCQPEEVMICHVKDGENYVSAGRSNDLPCKGCRKLRVS